MAPQVRASIEDGSLLGEARTDSITALDDLAAAEPGILAAPAAAAAAAAPAAAAPADGAAAPTLDDSAAQSEADRVAAAAAETAAKAATASEADEAAKAAAKTAEDEAAAKAAAAQPWDNIQLPPHTSVKAADSFKQLKEAAAAEAARLKNEVEASNRAIQELQAQAKAAAALPKVDPKLEAEISELRKFKLSHDVEADPSFQEFVGKQKANDEAVWSKLKASGLFSEASLEQGRKVGTKELDWEKVLPTLDVATRRFIEAKLVDNENIAEQKDKALAEAKANAKTFLESRSAAQMDTMKSAAAHVIKELPSFQRKDIPVNASAADKASIMAHNQSADLVVTKMNEALALGTTPEAVVELAIGTALAYQYSNRVKVLETEKSSLAKQVAELTTKHAAAVKELEDIKLSESPRSGSAPRYKPAAKVTDITTLSGSDSLDALAAEEAARQNG